jgi:beta-glucosidase
MHRRWEDCPAYGNFPGAKDCVKYGEGIFVGYRHFDTRPDTVRFPFGHGLRYTRFEYSSLSITIRGPAHRPAADVSFLIANRGDRAGSEIAQVYVRDCASSLSRPLKELKGFARTDIAAGKSKAVKFVLGPEAFAFYDPQAHAWTIEPGEFEILVGGSCADIRLSGKVRLKKKLVWR